MSEHIEVFLSEWTAAERAGATEKLAALLTEDFCGVGPLGFILPRPAWLGRHQQGLVYEHFGLEEIQVRYYGDVAVVVARNNARGTYLGHSLPEAVRSTLVIASNSEALRMTAIHMSFIAGTQCSPPLPGPSDSADSSAATNPDREER